jgi:hypothetical protein
MSERNPVISVSTPIFTTPSDIRAAVSVAWQGGPVAEAIAATKKEAFQILIGAP